MYICERCGNVIEDDEFPTEVQCHGYTSLGDSFDETIDGCCSCGGEYVEAYQCKVCGEWFAEDDLCYDVCDDCVKENETVAEALSIGEEYTEQVDINGFVAKVLSVEQINNILSRWVEENFVDRSKDVVEYCGESRDGFCDWLADKYGD